jgi:hypothetical protein
VRRSIQSEADRDHFGHRLVLAPNVLHPILHSIDAQPMRLAFVVALPIPASINQKEGFHEVF